jgi:hypothetical protein
VTVLGDLDRGSVPAPLYDRIPFLANHLLLEQGVDAGMEIRLEQEGRLPIEPIEDKDGGHVIHFGRQAFSVPPGEGLVPEAHAFMTPGPVNGFEENG